MRSNGLATILLLIPVLTVPALAIFGVPQIGVIQDFNFGETRETTREPRPGRSTRRVQDDSFTELEGFSTESDANDEPSSKRVDSFATENKPRNSGSRFKNETASVGFEDDTSLEQLNQTPRRAPANSLENQLFEDAPTETTSPKKTVIIDRSARQSKRQAAAVKSDDSAPTAFTDDADSIDQKVTQASFEESGEREKPRQPQTRSRRSRSNESRAAKPPENPDRPLTLKAAIERLNELDIRNFRLESGREAGQFIFVCSYAPPDTPRVSYRFEAGADEPLKAVEKVLGQIVEWQRQRQ